MTVEIRPGNDSDLFGAFVVFRLALHRLNQSLEQASPEDAPTPAQLAEHFEIFRTYTEHLARTADQFWVADDGGEIVGFARSVLRDGVRQLTELFVHPDRQSQGMGRRLLEAAFPVTGADNRVIISSPDVRAVTRYLKSGVKIRFSIYDWARAPEVVPFETDLSIQPFEPSAGNLLILNTIDRTILGYTREVDHLWLGQNRHGHFYRRDGNVVGYSYVSNRVGPIAMLHNDDFHAALAHVESEMTKYVDDVFNEFLVTIPIINAAAVEYVLRRGCQASPFVEHFMSDAPVGQYENYIFMDPPFIT